VNEWGYTPQQMDDNLNKLKEEFAGTYFRNVLNGIRRSELVSEKPPVTPAEEEFDVVNENDELAGTRVARSIAHRDGVRHRAVLLYLMNDKGELLLGRHSDHRFSPGLWTLASAGHVSAGQQYLEAMIREAEEEIGLKIDEAKLIDLTPKAVSTFTKINRLEGLDVSAEGLSEKLETLQKRLRSLGLIPENPKPEELFLSSHYDTANKKLVLMLVTNNEAFSDRFDAARSFVKAEAEKLFGKLKDKDFYNRDNRKYFAYRLTVEQEAELLAGASRFTTGAQAEYSELKFVTLEDAVSDFTAHPEQYTESLDYVSAPQNKAHLVQETRRSEVRNVAENIKESQRRLRRALQDPSKDYDMIAVGVHPLFLQQTQAVVEQLRGKVFHDSKEVVVFPVGPEGSITDSLSAIQLALEAKYGEALPMDEIKNKNIVVISMSGFGGRMPSNFGKGLLTLPGNRTFLEQVMRQRFYYWKSDFKGAMILSIDGVKAPQFQFQMGKAGISVIGHTMSRTDEGAEELGAFDLAEPFKAGAQPIIHAFEKLDRKTSDRYVSRGLLPNQYVNVSQADYVLSWEAYFWLYEQIKSVKEALTKEFEASGRTYRDDDIAYNWAEHLFEPATVSDAMWSEYVARLKERVGAVDEKLLERYRTIAVEARKKFGMDFINLGLQAMYLHTNRPDQYYDFILSLISNHNTLELFDLKKRNERVEDKNMIHPLPKSAAENTVISNSLIDEGAEIKERAVVLSSALEAGSIVEGQGAIINSAGLFNVPQGSIVDSVIMPAGERLEVKPYTFTRGYIIPSEDGTNRQVIVSIPIRLLVSNSTGLGQKTVDLRAQIDGKRLSKMKVFPRQSELTDQMPAMSEERRDGLSLDDLRGQINHEQVWAVFQKLYTSLADRNQSASAVAEKMREAVKNPSALRSEVRRVEAPPATELRAAAVRAAASVDDQRLGILMQQMKGQFGTGFDDLIANIAAQPEFLALLNQNRGAAKPFEVIQADFANIFIQFDPEQHSLESLQAVIRAYPKVSFMIFGAPEDIMNRLSSAQVQFFRAEEFEAQQRLKMAEYDLKAENLVQLLPGTVTDHNLIRTAMLAAAPLSQGTILVLGRRDVLEGVQTLSYAKALDAAFAAMKSIASAA